MFLLPLALPPYQPCSYISETPITGSLPDSWAGADAFPSLGDLCVFQGGVLLGWLVCMADCCNERAAEQPCQAAF